MAPAKAYRQHYDGYFDDAAGYDEDGYAFTVAPDTDDEPLDDLVQDSSVPGGSTSRPACAAVSAPRLACLYRRRIVEFCCGHDSRIGNRAPSDCEVIRLTVDDDLTTETGLAQAIDAVSDPEIRTCFSAHCLARAALRINT